MRRPEIDRELCKGCGKCAAACPKKLISLAKKINSKGYHFAEYAGVGCVGCGICYYSCPEPEAITVVEEAEDEHKV